MPPPARAEAEPDLRRLLRTARKNESQTPPEPASGFAEALCFRPEFQPGFAPGQEESRHGSLPQSGWPTLAARVQAGLCAPKSSLHFPTRSIRRIAFARPLSRLPNPSFL